jgi:hypothetical protein
MLGLERLHMLGDSLDISEAGDMIQCLALMNQRYCSPAYCDPALFRGNLMFGGSEGIRDDADDLAPFNMSAQGGNGAQYAAFRCA